MDLNHDKVNQNHLCYHYTTDHQIPNIIINKNGAPAGNQTQIIRLEGGSFIR